MKLSIVSLTLTALGVISFASILYATEVTADKAGNCPREIPSPLCLIPRDSNGNFIISGECQRDGDCDGAKKCCLWTCRNACKEPGDD